VWTIDASGVQADFISGTPAEIERRVKSFEQACSNPASDESALRQEAHALYELLIGPIADRLSANTTIIIEGDGAIGELPIQALIDKQGRYLTDSFDIVWSQGAAYRKQLRPSSALSAKSSILAVAVPKGDLLDARSSLPDAIAEATSAAQRFESSTLLVGSDASVSRVERGLTNAAIFHFAGHATNGTKGVGLVMAPADKAQREGGILSAEDLTDERLQRLQLAVLSACATEMGHDSGANDSESLVRALLRAGVPYVLATRWNLDSRAASTFTGKFYDALLSGKTPARALREATAELRSAPETAHPYYWAGLNVFGTN